MKRTNLEGEALHLERAARKLRRRFKIDLKKLLKQNKSTKAIAEYYGVSKSSVGRWLKRYGLVGLRKRGRKPLVRKPRPPKPQDKWIPTRKYIDDLDNTYRFVNIQKYPPFKYVNPRTLVCSNRKGNPRGHFTTTGIYFIVQQSDVHFLNYTRIRYSINPVDFDEINAWAKENMNDILSVQFQRASFSIERIVALTFLSPEKKPEIVKTEG